MNQTSTPENTVSKERRSKSGRSGRGTRVWIWLRVVLSVGLAIVAVQLINYLVARPGVRIRVDTTAKDVNSLDPATAGILEQLPDEVTVDVFFRAERQPMTRLVAQVQERTATVLERMSLISSGRLVVRHNDMSDFAAVTERLQTLRLKGLENVVVVSNGGQREVVRMNGGLATFDLGNPNPDSYRPPAIRSFDGEISLIKAILSVTRGERPHVYFTTGHGEADPFEDGQETAGALESALREDGFVIHTWHPAEDGDLPDDAFIVAVVGPTDALEESTRNRLTRFLKEGGRLLVAPHADPRYLKASNIQPWMESLGIEITEGTVMEPFPDPTGSGALITGNRSVFLHVLPSNMKRHEIVQPIAEALRTVLASRSHGLRVAAQPELGTGLTMPLLSSNPRISWLDTVPLNYKHEPEIEPLRGYDMAVASEFTDLTLEASTAPADGDGEKTSESGENERTSSRLVVLGSADFLYSALLESTGGGGSSMDFAKNSFNWLASREWRVNVSPKDPDLRLLPTERIPVVTRWVLWALPLTLFVLGILMAFIRSRGGPKHVQAPTPTP